VEGDLLNEAGAGEFSAFTPVSGRLVGGRFLVNEELMRMARPEKVAAVDEIRARFEDADAALLTEYRGLGVGEIAEVRGALRDAGSDYKVLKNTLTRIAVREVGLEDLVGMLEGPTAIAFVKGDAAAAAKALDDAAKKFPVLVIKGGVLNGKVIDASQAGQLARLEPREVQLAKIAMMMNSPAQQTANVLSALLRNLGSMLAQVVEKKGSGEPAAGTVEAEAAPEPEPAAEDEPAAEAAAEGDAEPAAQDEPAAEAAAEGDAEPAAEDEPAAEAAAEQPTATETQDSDESKEE